VPPKVPNFAIPMKIRANTINGAVNSKDLAYGDGRCHKPVAGEGMEGKDALESGECGPPVLPWPPGMLSRRCVRNAGLLAGFFVQNIMCVSARFSCIHLSTSGFSLGYVGVDTPSLFLIPFLSLSLGQLCFRPGGAEAVHLEGGYISRGAGREQRQRSV